MVEIESGKFTCKALRGGVEHWSFYGVKNETECREWIKNNNMILIAKNSEEYFRLKFDGKL